MNEKNDEFKKLMDEGFIEFVTFHPSYSYEEFVEGIRASTNEKGEIAYRVKDGIFKDLCKRARQRLPNFLIKDVKRILNKKKLGIPGILSKTHNISKGDKLKIKIVGNSGSKIIEGKVTDVGEIGLPDNDIELIQNEKILKVFLLQKNEEKLKNNSKYLLVIDEINRGNISKIFGELITLLEQDKRIGGENEITVTLPYSNEQFSVPQNLYIIGTMNTADRSIALIDVALRRRFCFVEFQVNYEILIRELGFDGEDAVKKKATEGDLKALMILALKEINRKIRDEQKLGKDKQIGHSYLLKLKDANSEELKSKALMIWKYEIMPLLEEYFYGRSEKINEVLNNQLGKMRDEFGSLKDEFDIEDILKNIAMV